MWNSLLSGQETHGDFKEGKAVRTARAVAPLKKRGVCVFARARVCMCVGILHVTAEVATLFLTCKIISTCSCSGLLVTQAGGDFRRRGTGSPEQK